MIKSLLTLKDIKIATSSFSLKNISLELFHGEVHVLMGENGSGKSLLMQIASGFIAPDSGKIYYKGTLLNTRRQNDILLSNTAYLRQDATMLRQLSIAENLFFSNLPYKTKLFKNINYDKLNAMCRELIDEFNLPFGVFDRVVDLGLAQRQIAEICRSYLSDADIIILDEPSAALTEYEKDILYKIIEKIKKRGAAIFYITHSLSDVIKIGDRISVLKKGEFVGTLKIKSSTEDDIIKLLSGNYQINRYPKLKVPFGKTALSVKGLESLGIIKDISFDLKKGEILGITGLAGSGRTLLANCLFGSAPYKVRELKVNNKVRLIKNPISAIENGIALVPEDRLTESIFRYLDIFENVAFSSLKRFTGLLSINSSYLEQAVFEYIRKLNIPEDTGSNNLLEYSGGNQQKAIMAKWIMSRAKIFILDEPTRGVDSASKIDIYNSINDLVKKGASVIIISSDIEEIIGMCDRVAVLASNTFVCDEKIEDISKEQIIKLSTMTN